MKILHLYPDLMNLYGDSGSLRVLARRLSEQGEDVRVERVDPGQTPDFSGCGFLYLGPGTERAQKAALEALRPHAPALKAALEDGLFALFTGNAASMLGAEVVDAGGKSHPALSFLDFTARETGERYTGDAILRHPELAGPLVGFFNRCETWEGTVSPLFQTVMGRGDQGEKSGEGCVFHNLLSTHLIGPILVKNPHFHRWLLGRLLGRGLKPMDFSKEESAYQVTLSALMERSGKG